MIYYPVFFSNLAQMSAIYSTFKNCKKKDGVAMLVFALCACNSECFFPVAREIFKTQTTVKNFYFLAKSTK